MNDSTTQPKSVSMVNLLLENSCLVVGVELSIGPRTVASSRCHECDALDLVWIRIMSIELMTRCQDCFVGRKKFKPMIIHK